MADKMSSFENPEEAYFDDIYEDFIEIETPDFQKTYREIRHIIYDGFIPIKLQMGTSNLLMKSLQESEFRYIDLITNNPIEKFPLYFLYTVVCIDGVEFIQDRKKYHHEIQELFRSMPSKVVDVIATTVNNVQAFHSASYENLEGYLYEKESRLNWEVYKTSALGNLFPHIKTLGFNAAQETWILFNQREDERFREESEFNQSKFIVSGFVGSKEIKKINNQERMRWNEELKRRQEIRLKNKFERVQLAKPVNTREELIAELKRQIKGEKDQHDKIIEQHESMIREHAQQRKAELEYLRMKANESKQDIPQGLSGGSKPVTEKEMEEDSKRIKNRKLNPELFRYEQLEKYTSKVEMTGVKKAIKEEPEIPQTSQQTPKLSIFDKEVQEELKKISKIK